MSHNFAVVGVGGYIAPRHLKAIHDTRNRLAAVVDKSDSVGILDRFDFDVRFFTEIERFERHLQKLRRGPEQGRIHYVSICSPNYLHDAHCRLALQAGADAICEKPLVINPWNLDALKELEEESGHRINALLQLRVHPKIVQLRSELLSSRTIRQREVCLTYITARGRWYHNSWKGSEEKSGGVSMNIGVHFFDMLLWIFGKVGGCRVHYADEKRISGFLELERARVRWFLSVDRDDLPPEVFRNGRSTFRFIEVDGQELEFTDGFVDLHTRVYEEVLAGRGFGIEEARGAIELVHSIRTSAIAPKDITTHPYLNR
jgi:UDP-N-acetyl-2-amino-2-deoxyglucuronate dehydrogenase